MIAIRRRLAGLVQVRPAQQEIRRDVLRLALPAMGEQLLSMMVGIVDTFLVGHLGASPLAAVGLANQWIFMAMTLFGAIATGSTALIARFIGARDPQRADQVLRQSMLLAAGIGVVATFLGLLFAPSAVVLLGAEGDVVKLSTDYLRIVSSIFFFSTLMFVGNASMRGAGDTRTPLYIMLVVNVINVSVAWTAINGPFGLPRMGVVGSALGAATGRLVGGLLALSVLLRGQAGIRLRLDSLRPDWDMIRRILHVGLPTGMEQVLMRTGQMVFARILAEMGMVTYAAQQVAINALSISFMPGFGFALAATTLVGQGLGAEDPEGAERRGYVAYRMGAGLMTVIGLAIVMFPAQVMGFFTNEPEVIALGTMPLRVVGLVQPMLAASMIFTGALRGAGDTRFPMLVTGGSIWFVRLPAAYLLTLTLGWGLVGAWSAMALDFSLRGIINFFRFRSGRWKTIKV
ncbi:MAG: MATE family efflux transporter [Anaerolineae bacterium]|nr:MATE family efflux transporter [Anaerolineae bacterium]